MEWPTRPVESLPPDDFVPEHCPWRACPSNRSSAPRFRYHRHGVFIHKCDRRAVRRFRCLACDRTFSAQTFAVTYYLKRPDLTVPVAAGLNAGSAHRQLGRSLGCAPSTVTRLSARLGRHALILSARFLELVRALEEPIVFDHFESFAFSQDYPLGIGTAVGQRSWFVYGIEPTPHRRGGRVSAAHKTRRKPLQPGYFKRGTYQRSFRTVVDELLGLLGDDDKLDLVTDGHPSYRQSLGRHPQRRRIRHRTYPNPPRGPKGSPRSPEAVVRDEQMFAVDLLHGLTRHSLAHHRRETIAFGRRHNSVVERMFLMVVWRNLVKQVSERRSRSGTPAMALGMTDEPWSWLRVLARRLFPWRVRVPESWMRIYRRLWITPALENNRRHELKNAF
jgi:transposase-like protein